jgi:hypothetical protein
MNRRRLIATLGAAAGVSGVLGTGAFTSVSADRSVDVSVVSDTDALLALRPADTPNGTCAEVTDGKFSLDLSATDGGPGVNPDALTVLDDVFTVTNEGTSAVTLAGEKSGPNPDAVVFGVNQATGGFTRRDVFHTLDPDAPTGIESDLLYEGDQPADNQTRTVPVGHSYYVSILIDTRGSHTTEVLVDSLEIEANAV